MMTPTPERLAGLARRLALPERDPDEAFVARIQLARRALVLEQEAARDRREQVLVELGAGAALLFAAHQLAAVGGQAAALLTPLVTGLSPPYSSPAFAGEGDQAKPGGGVLSDSEEPLHRAWRGPPPPGKPEEEFSQVSPQIAESLRARACEPPFHPLRSGACSVYVLSLVRSMFYIRSRIRFADFA
jgi:hypothetical protein